MEDKNKHAQAMAKKRWENKTPEEKSLHGKKMRQARTDRSKSTPSN